MLFNVVNPVLKSAFSIFRVDMQASGSSARQDRLHHCRGLHKRTGVVETILKMDITRSQLRIDLPFSLYLPVNWGAD